MRCLLIGNYGAGNVGDEALKEYFLVRYPQVEWTVVSASPHGSQEVPRLPFGLRSFLMTSWWKSLWAYRSSDAVIFGGGSLFTDAESVQACLLWWLHGFVARLFGTPILLAFQGIGPFRTRLGEWTARQIIRHARFVSVRDAESAARARAFGRTDVLESFDPVLLLCPADVPSEPGTVLVVIPRHNSGIAMRAAIRNALTTRRFSAIHILSMQPESPSECAICDSIALECGNDASVIAVLTFGDLLGELHDVSALITERYHGALAGLAAGIPTEIISPCPGDKLDALRRVIASGVTIDSLRQRALVGEQELLKSINMVK